MTRFPTRHVDRLSKQQMRWSNLNTLDNLAPPRSARQVDLIGMLLFLQEQTKQQVSVEPVFA